jgi:hypothetical protein
MFPSPFPSVLPSPIANPLGGGGGGLGPELVVDGGFDDASKWTTSGCFENGVSGGNATSVSNAAGVCRQNFAAQSGTFLISIHIDTDTTVDYVMTSFDTSIFYAILSGVGSGSYQYIYTGSLVGVSITQFSTTQPSFSADNLSVRRLL